jgi:hypothetical protein
VSGYVWHGKKPVHPCACGCGMEVSIARRSDSRNGQVKGRPPRYVSGHNPPRKSPVPLHPRHLTLAAEASDA